MAMATSATTTTSATASIYLCRKPLAIGRSCSNNYISFMRKSTRRFCVSSSADDLPSSSAATTEVEGTEESKIEVPKGPPSLISALNVEKALRGIGTLFWILIVFNFFHQSNTIPNRNFHKRNRISAWRLMKFLFRVQRLQMQITMAY